VVSASATILKRAPSFQRKALPLRHEGDLTHAVSFLPGFPDGSFGWAKVLPYLPSGADMPKVFLDYVGMGDSDKPKDYAYSTAERADLVEAIWRDLGVRSTTLVAFDFSSLVVLEHLRRRLERSDRGEAPGGTDILGVLIFNGGLFTDGHTHPWYTTPMLRRLPDRARQRVGRPFWLFKRMPGVRKMCPKAIRLRTPSSASSIAPWAATMACSTSPPQRASWRITKRKATGSTSVTSSRLIA
jgi:pimeloyl-ACP methyl ester carboxylesterase